MEEGGQQTRPWGHYLLSRCLLSGRMCTGGGAYHRHHGPQGLARASGGRGVGKMSAGAGHVDAPLMGPASEGNKQHLRNGKRGYITSMTATVNSGL